MKKSLTLAQFLVCVLFIAPTISSSAMAVSQAKDVTQQQNKLRRLKQEYNKLRELRAKRRSRTATKAELDELDRRMKRIKKQIAITSVVVATLAAIAGGVAYKRHKEGQTASPEGSTGRIEGHVTATKPEADASRVIEVFERNIQNKRQEIENQLSNARTATDYENVILGILAVQMGITQAMQLLKIDTLSEANIQSMLKPLNDLLDRAKQGWAQLVNTLDRIPVDNAEVRKMLGLSSNADSYAWWEILGVPATTTGMAAISAYRKKAVKIHPDRFPDQQGEATMAMQILNAAKDQIPQ